MPADETYDTPHPATMKTGHKEHCWNNRNPRGEGYWGTERYYYPNGRWSLRDVYVEDRMSFPCGQRKGQNPPGCEGCKELGEAK